MTDILKKVQFYDWSTKYQKRMIFSFKVENEADAKKALKRMQQKSGWYVEEHKHSGKIITNKKIQAAF